MHNGEGNGREPGAPPLMGLALVVLMLLLAAYMVIEVGSISSRYQRAAEANAVCVLAQEQGRFMTCKGGVE